jgi:hypothetical protein
LIAARAPEWPADAAGKPPPGLLVAPETVKPEVTSEGPFWRDPSGRVYIVNTAYAQASPHPAPNPKDPRSALAALVPPQAHATIGYADVLDGERHLLSLIDAALGGPGARKGTVVIVTYDEHGGFWDHVPPPHVDAWGPGTRVPTIVVTPWSQGQARVGV